MTTCEVNAERVDHCCGGSSDFIRMIRPHSTAISILWPPPKVGNEMAWWEDLHINALEIAKGIWEQTHPKSAASDTHQPDERAAKTTAKTMAI